jgi:RNA polymerase sigma-70 factor (ECF subfamily)
MRRENFERLYDEHAQALFGFLLYRTGDRALSEDLLGDTFERVLRSRRRFDPRKGSEKTWIYSIALNALRDHARRADAEQRALARAAPATASEGDALAAVELVDERDALARALAKLSDEEREAIALRYGADLTVPDMADALGEKLTTVDGRVYRALRKLRAELR